MTTAQEPAHPCSHTPRQRGTLGLPGTGKPRNPGKAKGSFSSGLNNGLRLSLPTDSAQSFSRSRRIPVESAGQCPGHSLREKPRRPERVRSEIPVARAAQAILNPALSSQGERRVVAWRPGRGHWTGKLHYGGRPQRALEAQPLTRQPGSTVARGGGSRTFKAWLATEVGGASG